MPTDSTTETSVQRSVTVPLDPVKAFELFTARMDEFWPREHHIGAAEMAEAVLEPKVGGRWFEKGVDGSECNWGRVVAWEPPSRLVLLWQITAEWQYDPSLETELEITFTPEGAGTRVELEHRNLDRFGDQFLAMRTMFEGPGAWAGTLAAYAAVAG